MREQGQVQAVEIVTGRDGWRDISRVVCRRPVAGRGVGRVRPEVRRMSEPGLVLDRDPVEQVVGQER